MNTETLLSSPFAMMLAPEDVFRALRASTALERLPGRICRPLDKFETATTASVFAATDAVASVPENQPLDA